MLRRRRPKPVVRNERVDPGTRSAGVLQEDVELANVDRVAVATDEDLLGVLLTVASFAHARHALFDRTIVEGAEWRALVAEVAPAYGDVLAPIADTLSARNVRPWRGLRGIVGHDGDASEGIHWGRVVVVGEEHRLVGLS